MRGNQTNEDHQYDAVKARMQLSDSRIDPAIRRLCEMWKVIGTDSTESPSLAPVAGFGTSWPGLPQEQLMADLRRRLFTCRTKLLLRGRWVWSSMQGRSCRSRGS
jgi:hypothetical protein